MLTPKNLVIRRRDVKISQSRLAHETGLSRTRIQMFEQGLGELKPVERSIIQTVLVKAEKRKEDKNGSATQNRKP